MTPGALFLKSHERELPFEISLDSMFFLIRALTQGMYCGFKNLKHVNVYLTFLLSFFICIFKILFVLFLLFGAYNDNLTSQASCFVLGDCDQYTGFLPFK